MRQRISGISKKGDNLLYGMRYARVIARTWWRERRDATRVPREVAIRPLAEAPDLSAPVT